MFVPFSVSAIRLNVIRQVRPVMGWVRISIRFSADWPEGSINRAFISFFSKDNISLLFSHGKFPDAFVKYRKISLISDDSDFGEIRKSLPEILSFFKTSSINVLNASLLLVCSWPSQAAYNLDVYQPRNPKASAYYKCVENHFEELERAYPKGQKLENLLSWRHSGFHVYIGDRITPSDNPRSHAKPVLATWPGTLFGLAFPRNE